MQRLKLVNLAVLLMLNYSNASVSLPQAVQNPDADFLAVTLTITLALCLVAFASGWLVARTLKVDPSEKAALVFGLGMNNNGTGLVLATMALAIIHSDAPDHFLQFGPTPCGWRR